jgi:hypothetical protein
MSHPKIHNHTPFEFAPLFLPAIDGQPLFVPLLKATFLIDESASLQLAGQQLPPVIGGEFYGAPETSSLKYAPEGAIVKPATDVVLLGHAYPQRPGDTETDVGLRVGSVRKLVRVRGDRYWINSGGIGSMTDPEPFAKIPLRWEHAFGGWDRSSPDPREHRFEKRNPVGAGFRTRWHDEEAAVAVPNIEHPGQLIRSFEDRPEPVGFGFVAPNWQPRAAYAGTYDESWMKTRRPLLPEDFDARFLNAAPADQVVAGYLRGDEEVVVLNASPRGRLGFHLPATGALQFHIEMRAGGIQSLTPVLDTLIVDTDEHRVLLLWRAAIPIANVPGDIAAVHIEGKWWAGTEPVPFEEVA